MATFSLFRDARRVHVVEQVGERLPYVGVAILAQALVVEAVPAGAEAKAEGASARVLAP
tara:strand:- start:528 stop:704 length:177 start_codon:yes stop_codon:yes gene_type:complete